MVEDLPDVPDQITIGGTSIHKTSGGIGRSSSTGKSGPAAIEVNTSSLGVDVESALAAYPSFEVDRLL
jgi:hypothetical protein